MTELTGNGQMTTGRKVMNFITKNNTFFVFIILIVLCSILTTNFFAPNNLTNLLRQNAPLGIASLGMLMVILTGGIDLSIGMIAMFSNVMFAYTLELGYVLPLAVLISIAFGVLFGTISGFLVAYQKLAPFVVTLAIMSIARGFGYIISHGSSIQIKNEAFLLFSRSYIIGIPAQFWLMIGIFIIGFLIFRYLKYGRLVVSIGSNKEAVRLSGIRVNGYIMSVYMVSGLCSAIAGLLICGRTGVGSPLVGDGMEMDAIASAVIGGASLAGGRGSVIKTLVGVFILGIIGNIMNLMKVPAYPQQVIKGMIIVGAILLQKYTAGKKSN